MKTRLDEDRALGLDADITRRDVFNATLLRSGAALLAASGPSGGRW